MTFVKPLPFQEAIQKLGDQSIVGSAFTSTAWADLPVELRENAFFSSRVESAQFLNRAKEALGDFLAGNRTLAENGKLMLATGSRVAFVSQMQDFLAREGVLRTGGGLTDIASEKRLGLIFDIKTRQAQDHGFWLQGMHPDVLDEFPAMRFIRVQDVREPRELHQRFEDQVYLKTDPIWWLEINHDFGVPWGPWGWGCGHDVEDVDRDEAEQLGLLKAGQRLDTAPLQKFLNLNRNLQASTKMMDPDLVDKLLKEFGDKIRFENDTLKWKVNYDERTGDSTSRRIGEPAKVDAGRVAAATEAIFSDLRSPYTGAPLDVGISREAGASLSAVASERKPLYHDDWGTDIASDIVARLRGLKLPNVHIFATEDGHVIAYQPDAVRQIVDANPSAYSGRTLFDKVYAACENGTNGDLLGYGARSMTEPGLALVEITDGDTRVFAFYCRPEVATVYGNARALDFERAYGREYTYLVTPRNF